MAEVVLTAPFAEIHGSIGNDKIINRQKKYRDERGRVLHEGKQEAYVVKHPRNYKKNPRLGVEQTNFNCWREACQRTSQILLVAKLADLTPEQQEAEFASASRIRQLNHIPDYYTLAQSQELLDLYKARFNAQLPNKRSSHPDPDALIDPKTGSGKRYFQFHAFLRAIIFNELRSRLDNH